uniref:Uncharacterized protein n=1 Tax=Oryzias latipes TaxID=8090 RepID=A0A3P9KMJ7_ORYLA
MAENGVKGKPPYSVETPYGFQIDLDFLKYVEDIEKGNTIKRVPIQRRSKGPRASTLPRNLNPSGCGYRPSPWGSTGALGPRSPPSDTHHHGYSLWAHSHRPPLFPTDPRSLAELEAKIKEFDEQPLGEHIRPHLLRASSLPLTVLLRQESESADDRSSIRSSRDYLRAGNTSCEDVFNPPDSPQPQDCSGLLRRLSEALERVGELEMEVRVIPELRAQICILQEERERLRLGLVPHLISSTENGNTKRFALTHRSIVDMKRSIKVRNSTSDDNTQPMHEWKSSTDLDELLTVTSLQAKVAALEQKLHETSLELQKVTGLLREQQAESGTKDKKIENLINNPGMWVCAERVMVEQDGDETVVRSMEPDYSKGCSLALRHLQQKMSSRGGVEPADGTADSMSTAAVLHHIRRIKNLLDQQWQCVCAEGKPGDKGRALKHLDPKVNSLQEEMMELVDILLSHYQQNGDASKSTIKTDTCAQKSETLRSEVPNERLTVKGNLSDSDCKIQSLYARRVDAAQTDAKSVQTGMAARQHPEKHVTPVDRRDGQRDGGAVTAGADGKEKTPPRQQKEGNSGSGARAREANDADFVSACHFVKAHMGNMDNPGEDMRKALVTLFQHWFTTTAEEASEAGNVAACVRGVKKETPSLLAFLVNLPDDNGNTVLHYSVSHCNYSIVSLLLDTGVADVNVQNKAGYTAVMLASLTAPDGPDGMETVRKLMELGNLNIRSSQTGQTALHLAVRHGRDIMVRLLLSCGADTNIQDNQGTTALMFAAEKGHTHVARLLLERSQSDLTLTDKRGRTALFIALQGSHSDTAALLQAHAKARAL